MPKCKNCGADVKEGDLFCGFCGKRIETAPEIPAQPIPQPQLQQAAYAKEAMAQAQQPQAAQAAQQEQPVILEKVTLRSPLGEVKNVSTGFCGWMVLFGPFLCLYRRDFKMFFILLLFIFALVPINMLISSLAIMYGGVYWVPVILLYVIGWGGGLYILFKYNAIYIKGLLKKGWQPLGPNDAYTLRQKGIMI